MPWERFQQLLDRYRGSHNRSRLAAPRDPCKNARSSVAVRVLSVVQEEHVARDPALVELRLGRAAVACGLAVAALAATVLVGWFLGVPGLTWFHPSFDAMRPNTAVSFLLAGLAVAGIPFARQRRWRPIVLGIAGTFTVMNAIYLIEWATGWDPGIDTVMAPFVTEIGGRQFRTSPTSSACFLAMGIATASTVLGRIRRVVPWLLFAAAISPLLFLLQSGYGSESVRETGANLRMSVHSGLSFLLLATGSALGRALHIPDTMVADPGPAGVLLRRLLPAAAIGTVGLGWLTVEAVRMRLFSALFAAAFFAAGSLAVTGAAVWLTAKRLRRIDRQRRRSFRTFEALNDASPAAMALLDPDGTVRAWNRSAEILLGLPAERAIGAMLTVASTGGEGEVRTRLLQGFPLCGVDVCFRHPELGDLDLGLSSAIVPDERGAMAAIVAVWIDMTQRKRAEMNLATQYERVSLMNQITRAIAERQDPASIHGAVLAFLCDRLAVDQCVVALVDEGGAFIVASGRGGESGDGMGSLSPGSPIDLGARSESLLRDNQTVHDPDTALATEPFARRAAAAGMRSLLAVPLSVGDAVSGVLVAARRSPDAFSAGEAQFLRQLAEHVALAGNQARLHEDLRQAYENLRASQRAVTQQERLRAMGQMASGIAHDINNSLSPIVVYSELALQRPGDLDERTRHALEIILKAGEDVAGTVARMREFYRPRGERDDLVPVDLNLLVMQVIDLTRPRWKDMPEQQGFQVVVATDLHYDLPRISAVETEIRDALTNLVFNAVDAMPEGGTLTLRTRRQEGGRVAIEVSDTGTGMDEDTRARCLEPFFSTKGERGTGLGLSMVFGLAQRHGGRIEIDSEPGRGTTMRLLLPVGGLRPESGMFKAPVVLPRGLRLLVVDDDPMLRQSLLEMLSDEGHTVDVASTGAEALARFREASGAGIPYSLVITDHGMPGMTGRELGRAIKDESPSTPVILVTGWGALSREDTVDDGFVDEIVSKPPRLKRMREVMARVLTRC